MTLVLVIAYWQVALCSYALQWDAVNQIFVWHRYMAECFHAHLIPLWAPYARLGYPMYADPQSGLFYPVVWLLTLGGRYTLASNDLELFIHIVIAAWGMKFLLEILSVRRDTAAVFGLIYAMSGPVTGHATHTTLVVSMGWVPWVLGAYIQWLRSQRMSHLLLAVLCVYMEVAGGYMGITIILMYVMAAILIYHIVSSRREHSAFGKVVSGHLMFVGLTILVSAGLLYALAQGQPYMDRSEGLSRAGASSVPFTPVSLLSLLYPGLIGDKHIAWSTDTTMQNLYIGIVPLILGLLLCIVRPRRGTLFIMVASLVMLLAAMGDHTPVRGWFYEYLPLMRLFRHAGIFRVFTCIGLVILGAQGYDALQDHHFRKIFKVVAMFLSIAVMSVWLIAISGKISLGPFAVPAVLLPVVILSLTAFIVFSLPEAWLKPHVRMRLLALIILCDLGLSVQMVMYTTIASGEKVKDVQRIIDQYPTGFPIPTNDPITAYNQWNDPSIAPPVWQNAGFLRKQISFEGYNGFNLKNYNLLIEKADFFQLYEHQRLVSTQKPATIRISSFDPGHFGIDVDNSTVEVVTLAQMYFPGWKACVDNTPVAIMETKDHFVSCMVGTGHHSVDFYFSPWLAKAAFIYTITVMALLLAAIGIYRPRLN